MTIVNIPHLILSFTCVCVVLRERVILNYEESSLSLVSARRPGSIRNVSYDLRTK